MSTLDSHLLLRDALIDEPDELSFRAIRSILDTWQDAHLFQSALSEARAILASWPEDARSVDCETESTASVVDSPSWPVVCQLYNADPAAIAIRSDLFGLASLSFLHLRVKAQESLIDSKLRANASHLRGLSVFPVSFPANVLERFIDYVVPDNLEEFGLGGIGDEQEWAVLSNYLASPRASKLRALTFFYLAEHGIANLCSNPPPSLADLRIHFAANVFAILNQTKRLAKQILVLNVSSQSFGDNEVAALSSCSALTTLKCLDLSANPVTALGMHKLAKAPFISSIEKLNLYGTAIGDEGVVALAASPLKSLAAIDFGNTGCTDEGAKIFLSNLCSSSLSVINFNQNHLGDSSAIAIARSKTLTSSKQLSVLKLMKNRVTDLGLVDLAGSAALSNLYLLDLSMNDVGDRGLDALALSPNLGRLRILNLGLNKYSPDGLARLSQAESLGGLRNLSIGSGAYPCFNPSVVGMLLDSQILASIRSLTIIGKGFGDEEAVAMATCPARWKRLRDLQLVNVSIGDKGLHAISNSPNFKNLWSLIITTTVPTMIGDEGVLAIAASEHLTNLVELNIPTYKCSRSIIELLMRSPVVQRLDRISFAVDPEIWEKAANLRPVLRSFLFNRDEADKSL